jgi:Carbohydrate/starch-binding module (family 21)
MSLLLPLAFIPLVATPADDAVRVANQGANSVVLGCSGICVTRESFWVDLSVRNDAYDKEVAIVWSSDGWASQHVAYASYEQPLPDGREQWGLDVTLGQFWSGHQRPAEVAYAAYVRMAGTTHWDRANDHYVYQPVDANRPVRLLRAQVGYEPGVGAVLSGAVRVFDLDDAKQVSVRYTTDGWRSFRDVDASWARDDDWSFRIEGLGLGTLPEEVAFAVRYRAGGRELWDAAEGANYRRKLQPELTFQAPRGSAGLGASGIVSASVAARTDLPITRVQLAVDEATWGEPYAQFSTAALEDGTHTLHGRVELEGGFVAEAQTSFTVKNRFAPLGVWRPTLPETREGARGSSWGFAVGADGRVYLQWERPWESFDAPLYHGVLRYASFGDAAAPFVYQALPSGPNAYPPNVWDIAVDESGRVTGLHNDYPGVSLFAWDEDGRLGAPAAIAGFDVGRAIAAGDGSLWIVGTCPGWRSTCAPGVSRVSEAGVEHVDLPDDVTSPERPWAIDPGAATFADGALWVLRGRTITRVAPDAHGRLAVGDVITFADGVDVSSDALARGADGRFYVLSSQSLLGFSPDGKLEGAWSFGGTDALPGGNSLPRALAVLADGTIAVLDVSGASLVRFAPPAR